MLQVVLTSVRSFARLDKQSSLVIFDLFMIFHDCAFAKHQLYPTQNEDLSLCFAGKDWQLAATLGTSALHASFFRKANENVQVAVELEASLRTMESVTTFAYQLDLPKMNLLFKGKRCCDYFCTVSL